jgi:hypothetical protein
MTLGSITDGNHRSRRSYLRMAHQIRYLSIQVDQQIPQQEGQLFFPGFAPHPACQDVHPISLWSCPAQPRGILHRPGYQLDV